jgi:RNA 3'-terminal phosphate cyclase
MTRMDGNDEIRMSNAESVHSVTSVVLPILRVNKNRRSVTLNGITDAGYSPIRDIRAIRGSAFKKSA